MIRFARAALLFALLTVVMTWPQAARLTTDASEHYDVFFNMWRLGSFAHALATSPTHLLDGNIFYPESRTLTYSDAMVVESVTAAPLLWAGVPPVLVHNLMLLGGIVLSAAGIFVLAAKLTGSQTAGITAGIVFAFVPYRFDHYMHLELQWTVWIPWAFWALHKLFETGAMRDAMLLGLFITLQFMSSIYYGLFLAVLIAVCALFLLCGTHRGVLRTRMAGLIVAAGTAAILIVPYAIPYLASRRTLGPRPEVQVVMFSARPSSYRAATTTNYLYGDRSARLGRPERAFECRSRAWLTDVESADTLAEMEQLGLAGGLYGELVATLEKGAVEAGDPNLQAQLWGMTAQLLEDPLGRASDAIEAWRSALSARPDDRDAFLALERLLSAASRSQE